MIKVAFKEVGTSRKAWVATLQELTSSELKRHLSEKVVLNSLNVDFYFDKIEGTGQILDRLSTVGVFTVLKRHHDKDTLNPQPL